VESRQSLDAADEKARKEAMDKARSDDAQGDAKGGGDARRSQFAEQRKKLAEIRKAENDKLAANLAKFLSQDQVSKAIVPLAAYDPMNDRMVHVVAEFKLDDAKMYQSMQAIETHVVAMAKVRDSDDRSGVRTTTRESREKLA